jgi:hypothetical protein
MLVAALVALLVVLLVLFARGPEDQERSVTSPPAIVAAAAS